MTKKFQVTAIISDKRGNILSVGQNSYIKTHPLQAKYARKVHQPQKIYLHAEIHAITKCKDLSLAHKIQIFRYKENGDPGLAKPCKICQEALNKTGIKIVEYTYDS